MLQTQANQVGSAVIQAERGLEEIEEAIATGIDAVKNSLEVAQRWQWEVGLNLKEINERKLYSGTFAGYCKERWQIERAQAYRMIECAVSMQAIAAEGSALPISEYLTRPLYKLSPADRAKAWNAATSDLPEGEQPTLKAVALAVATIASPEPPAVLDAEIIEPVATEPEVIDEVVEAGEGMKASPLESMATGHLSKISAFTGTDFAIAFADLGKITEMYSAAIAGLKDQLVVGGRLIVVGCPIDIFNFASDAFFHDFTIEHSLVLETSSLKNADKLFGITHAAVVVFKNGEEPLRGRTKDNALQRTIEYAGDTPSSLLGDNLPVAISTLLPAFCKVGDRVLCATGGDDYIAESLCYQAETHYLAATQEKLNYYQGVYGD